ncbi:MAG: signal recognition particle-docking protein FtsY, partial [Actinomycetota bacterium]
MKWFKRDNDEQPSDGAVAESSSLDSADEFAVEDAMAPADARGVTEPASTADEALATVADAVEAPAGRMRGRLFARLRGNKGGLGSALASVFAGKPDAVVWEALEESLLMADVGVDATTELIKTLQRRLGSSSTAGDARQVVREELLAALGDQSHERTLGLAAPGESPAPQVVMVVGVNGTG